MGDLYKKLESIVLLEDRVLQKYPDLKCLEN